MEPKGSLPCSQKPTTGPYHESDKSSPYISVFLRLGRSALCNISQEATRICLTVRSFSPLKANPQAGEPPLVGSPRSFYSIYLQYPPYLEAVSSIRNLRTRHAVVTRDILFKEYFHPLRKNY
jgi:hypothetical protein